MTGDNKRGDAVADQWRDKFAKGRRESDLALTELDVRAEMKSMGEEETTDVIQREALERQRKKESDPPSSKIVISLVRAVKGWPQALVAVCVLALVAWWLWLRTR